MVSRGNDIAPIMEQLCGDTARQFVLDVKHRMEFYYQQMAFYDQWLSKYQTHMAYHQRMMNHGNIYLLKHSEYMEAHESTSIRHNIIMDGCQQYISSLEPYLPKIDPVLWSKITSPQIFPFLELPGEIRNDIYGLCLISKTGFTLGLFRFQPSMTSLLRVNKQIHHEASSVFYHENRFRFPASLFVDAPIYKSIQEICGLTAVTLQRMKKITLDIPVHGQLHDSIQHLQTSANLDDLWGFIFYHNGSDLDLQINYQITWGESYNTVPWPMIRALLRPFNKIEDQGRGKVEVNVETQAFWLDDCIDDLHIWYDRSWSFHVNLNLQGTSRGERLCRENAIKKFRKRCMLVPGLRDFYTETRTWDKYMVRPRIVKVADLAPGDVGL